MNVTVVGAGVAGLTVATELAERGCKVQVIDRAEGFGRAACSWYAGGMLAPWCEGDTAEEPVVRLGQEAIGWWRDRVPDVIEQGSLVVTPARDTGELARFARRTQSHQTLDAAGLADLEPDLQGRFRQALFFGKEAHLNPRKAIAALLEGLGRLGVTIGYATSLEAHGIRGAVVVDTRGFAARDVLTRPARRQGRNAGAEGKGAGVFTPHPVVASASAGLSRAAWRRHLHGGRHPD